SASYDIVFYNTNEKGGCFFDVGTSHVGDFYAPFIDTKNFDVFTDFGKFPEQTDTRIPKEV
ncbi:cell division protein FtsK, partial [Enterococcus faecalis]